MYHLSSYVVSAALAAAVATTLVSEDQKPLQVARAPAEAAAPAGPMAVDVNRSGKGDRLTAAAVSTAPRAIAVVEITGQPDAPVVYRDRLGAVLFRSEPAHNTSIIAKNVSLPQITLPTAVSERPAAAPLPAPTARKPEPLQPHKLRIGCESPVSIISDAQLPPGRCLTDARPTDRPATRQVAAAD